MRITVSTAPQLSILELQSYYNQTGRWLLNATVNQLVTLTLRAVAGVPGVSIAIHMSGNISAQASASLNPTTGVFTWTPANLDPVDVRSVLTTMNI